MSIFQEKAKTLLISVLAVAALAVIITVAALADRNGEADISSALTPEHTPAHTLTPPGVTSRDVNDRDTVPAGPAETSAPETQGPADSSHMPHDTATGPAESSQVPEDHTTRPAESSQTPEESSAVPVTSAVTPATSAKNIPSDRPSAFVFSSDGRLLFVQGDLDRRLYPASVTKLVSAMTAIELVGNDTSAVTVGDELSLVKPGSSVSGLAKGDVLTVSELIEAMLISSGNDAAYTLAAYAGRKADPGARTAQAAVAAFVKEMNAWSARNRLTGSNWKNPDGYHDGGHYSTMNDLIIVAQAAMNDPFIRKTAGIQKKTVSLDSGGTLELESTNLLLDKESKVYNEKCIGLKTGYTPQAGDCIIAAFRDTSAAGERILYVGLFGLKGVKEIRFTEATRLFREYAGKS